MERRDEAAGCGIDVDADLIVSFGVDLVDDIAHCLDWIVVSSIVIAHDANHAHGLIVDLLANLFWVQRECFH